MDITYIMSFKRSVKEYIQIWFNEMFSYLNNFRQMKKKMKVFGDMEVTK